MQIGVLDKKKILAVKLKINYLVWQIFIFFRIFIYNSYVFSYLNNNNLDDLT